jgi:hypothetical protein
MGGTKVIKAVDPRQHRRLEFSCTKDDIGSQGAIAGLWLGPASALIRAKDRQEKAIRA